MKFTARARSDESLALMTEVLRAGGDLASEYPLVFGEGAPGRVLALEEAGVVRSACAVLERVLVHPGGRTRVGMIGSVSTHPKARGRGFATHLLEYAEGVLREAGCEHAMLWADDPKFYGRRGYALDGEETDFLIDRVPQARQTPGVEVRAMDASDCDAIHALYAAHASRVDRTPEETARSLGCPGMRVLLATCGGETLAYVCFGRGGDLAGVAHEWGGAPEGVLACLAELLIGAEPIFLMAPGVPGSMGAALDACGALRVQGRLGMTKPLGERSALPPGAFVWGLDSI